MYLKQKYEVFSLVVGATAVNSLDWEQNQTHYFHIENCWYGDLRSISVHGCPGLKTRAGETGKIKSCHCESLLICQLICHCELIL